MICTGSLLLSKAAGIFQCADADAFALKFARMSEGQLNVGGVASARNIIGPNAKMAAGLIFFCLN